jgi:D-lyxose ketol-isomerase
MITASELDRRQREAADLFRRAGLFVRPEEVGAIEIADFGLSEFERSGLGILVYVNTERCCAKELSLRPGQTCPEHLHPPVGDDPGKEETFRCRWGRVHLYVEGPPAKDPRCRPPEAPPGAYTVWHEVVLGPGEQHTIVPGTKHWFQAGPDGAVVSEFSTRSRDERDLFSDPRIRRATEVV